MKVIILDGEQRSSLAMTRSLGKRHVEVIVGAESQPSISSRSRYCGRSFTYPSPYKCPGGFVESLVNILRGEGNPLLVPMTDVTVGEVLSNRRLFETLAVVPFVDFDRFSNASNKSQLFSLAQSLGIPTPRTIFSHEAAGAARITERASDLGYPLVVKPAQSRYRSENGWIKTAVRYAQDEYELARLLEEDIFRRYPFIVQERIDGPGLGVFLLVENGRVLARFAHRRIRERPPSGGVSVLCESIPVPDVASDSAERLLRELNWYGVAMVEFKWDKRDNLPKLMEVNGRFWGSLQLAVSAGVDFPFLLYRLASGQGVETVKGYKVGVKSRWELGDLDHLLLRIMKKSTELSLPAGFPSKSLTFMCFFTDFLRPSIRNEVLRIDDPLPFLIELKQYLTNLCR